MRHPNADTMVNEAQPKPSGGKPPEGVANHTAVRFDVIEKTFDDDGIEEDPVYMAKYQDNSTIIAECYKIRRRRFLVSVHEDWSVVNFTFLDRLDCSIVNVCVCVCVCMFITFIHKYMLLNS